MPKKTINNKITISFTQGDDDLIEFLEEQKKENKASEFIRNAIREKIQREENKEEENFEIIQELKEITKRINLIEENKTKNKDTTDNYNSNFVVTRENRFGTESTKEKEEEVNKEKIDIEVQDKEKNRDEQEEDSDLKGALDYFDF